MADRSNRADVRNPMLAMPAIERFRDLDPAAQEAVRLLCRDISADARRRAQECWDRHKAPMAAYWKAKAVDARHIAIAIASARKFDAEAA